LLQTDVAVAAASISEITYETDFRLALPALEHGFGKHAVSSLVIRAMLIGKDKW